MIRDYLVVGITEQFDDFLSVLDTLFPSYFNGISTAWQLQGEEITQKGATASKQYPSPANRAILTQRMKYEVDLYNIGKAQTKYSM